MRIAISDFNQHKNFLPLSFTRSIADFRIGILTIREKWETLLKSKVEIITEKYLQEKYPLDLDGVSIYVSSTIIPNEDLINAIYRLENQTLVQDEVIIAYHNSDGNIAPEETVEYKAKFIYIKNSSDIFSLNGECIKTDFEILTKDKKSEELSATNIVFGDNSIFIEKGAFVECSTINTTDGPVYIGKDSKIMEGCNIRGPFAICEHAEIKMGAKVYGPTTIGPWCKVGGELNNVVFFSYSSKAHDGFLGNAVIGEWCNLGADTNNSNLKNNYAIVKLWSYETERFKNTGLQFCGLIMGDHSKSAINTMFNTGTIAGVSSNIFGAGFPRNFIPSFSWGGHAGMSVYKLETAFDVMGKVMARRGKELSDVEKNIYQHIFEETAKYRNF